MRSENVFLKLVGWTLWSFTLALGALFVFNKYFNKDYNSFVNHKDAVPAAGALVDNVIRFGFRNAGSWLLSIGSLGLLAQLTFALPRIAALHSVRYWYTCCCLLPVVVILVNVKQVADLWICRERERERKHVCVLFDLLRGLLS